MNNSHRLSSEILKACDIRGIVGADLGADDAYLIGRAFGTMLKRKGKSRCAVGRDGRLSSDDLCNMAVRGLLESGVDVVNLGLVPTPLVYHSVLKKYSDSGLMVTASHNPAEYNGFKFLTDSGPYHGDDIQMLAEIASGGTFTTGTSAVHNLDILPLYLNYLKPFLKILNGHSLNVVWDPGNGATAAILGGFLDTMPGRHRVICGDVDGTFPVHHPDPSLAVNMVHLSNAVIAEKADLGIAFDGDGDRIGVVDNCGILLSGDLLLVLYARDFLKTNPGEFVMSEVKTSRFFYEDVKANGGRPIMWKVGHTHQKEKMKSEGILFAGETSGHMFFAENGGYDDGLFSAIKLLNLLSEDLRSLSGIRQSFPRRYDSGEIRLVMEATERKRVTSCIQAKLTQSSRVFSSIDGIRVESDDGYWMIRGSNTQPHLSMRCEAASPEGLRACISDIQAYLCFCGINVQITEELSV